MTIKVTRDQCCDAVFEPYTLTLHVTNQEDHRALKYLSMCNSRVPQALYDRAEDSYQKGRYYPHAADIKCRTKSLLISMLDRIPKRGGM
jgi:hypothetical protein